MDDVMMMKTATLVFSACIVAVVIWVKAGNLYWTWRFKKTQRLLEKRRRGND